MAAAPTAGMLTGEVPVTARKVSEASGCAATSRGFAHVDKAGTVRKRVEAEGSGLRCPVAGETLVLSELAVRVGHSVGSGDVAGAFETPVLEGFNKKELTYVVGSGALGVGFDAAVRSMVVGEVATVLIDAVVAPDGGLRNHHARVGLKSIDDVVVLGGTGAAHRRRAAANGAPQDRERGPAVSGTSTVTLNVHPLDDIQLWDTPDAATPPLTEDTVPVTVHLGRGAAPVAVEEAAIHLAAGDAFLLRVNGDAALAADLEAGSTSWPSSPARLWHVTLAQVEHANVDAVADAVALATGVLKPVANAVLTRANGNALRARALYEASDAMLSARARRVRGADYASPADAAADRRALDAARAPLLSNLALCHKRVGDARSGERTCAACLDVCARLADGDDAMPPAFVAKVHFRRAACLSAMGETDDALVALDRAAALDPGAAASCAAERKKLLREQARRAKEDRARLAGMFAPPPPTTTRAGGVVIQEVEESPKPKAKPSLRLYSDEETVPERDAFPARRDANLSRGLVPVDLAADFAEIEAEEKAEASRRDMMSKMRGDLGRPSMGNPWDRDGKRAAKEMNDYYATEHAKADAEREAKAAVAREAERQRRVAEGTWNTVQTGLNGARLDDLL